MMMTDRDNRDLERQGTENRVDGKTDEFKGRLKDAAGGLTNDNQMQAEGKWDKVKGKAKDAVGRAQESLGREEKRSDREEI
jgi:uncharacterized protein YjbJ (UPF0337 family)